MDCIIKYVAPLTPRERMITTLLATGASKKEIAQELSISIKTVKNILTKVFYKTGTRSRTELAVHLFRLSRGERTS